MANSKYEYVKSFERADNLLPNTWIVIRLDGRGFHKFSARHNFAKPNDLRAIQLMNAAAVSVLRDVTDIILGYGVSDEYSFVLDRSCNLFERRESKLISIIASTFTSYYTYLWPKFFPDTELQDPLPSFDARAVCYPSRGNIRDYLAWRQVDCHVNNLFNTTFWALVERGGLGRREAEQRLAGTFSKDKHEILFGFGINYNNEPEIWKKGSVAYRELKDSGSETSTSTAPAGKAEHGSNASIETTAPPEAKEEVQEDKAGEHERDNDTSPGQTIVTKVIKQPKRITARQAKKIHKKQLKAAEIVVQHVDIIEDKFWNEHPYLLGEGVD
ncbi:putative tRNAHis guanylyltransferase [Kalaharituber pfeilii]|nr:putative tRNAHis guanylyltransferase [Kalaharituber pfeilii]